MLKRVLLNLKELSDASAVSLTEKEYGSAAHFSINIIEIFSTNV